MLFHFILVDTVDEISAEIHHSYQLIFSSGQALHDSHREDAFSITDIHLSHSRESSGPCIQGSSGSLQRCHRHLSIRYPSTILFSHCLDSKSKRLEKLWGLPQFSFFFSPLQGHVAWGDGWKQVTMANVTWANPSLGSPKSFCVSSYFSMI